MSVPPNEDPQPKPPTRGVTHASGRFGQAFGEKAYVTQGYPDGVRSSELANLPDAVQVETMKEWFRQNFKRPDAMPGPDLSSLDGLFRHGGWAEDALVREFETGNTVRRELISQAAAEFNGIWTVMPDDDGSGEGQPARRMPNRRVVEAPAGEGDFGDEPLIDRAYLTPRFPDGIKRSRLKYLDPVAQRETAIIWFLANYERAEGALFGFDSPEPENGTLGGSPLGSFTLGGGRAFDGPRKGSGAADTASRIAGLDEGRWSDAREAADLLQAEFQEQLGKAVLAEIAAALIGLWELRPEEERTVALGNAEQQRVATLQALEDFEALVRQLPTSRGQRGHNGSPEGLVEADLPEDMLVLGPEERDRTLRATADMRMAMQSENNTAAAVAWDIVLPVVLKLGSAISKQIDNLCTNFTGTFGVGAAVLALGVLSVELGILDKGEAITAGLAALQWLRPKGR